MSDARAPADAAAPDGVAVVGGGWAGLAAAVELTAAGRAVTLFEAAPQLGGRARAIDARLGDERVALDNGQHLMIGAYRECLRLVGVVAGSVDRVLERRPLALVSTDGLAMRPPARLPAPWHLAVGLAGARGLPWGDRFAMVRALGALRAARWQVPAGETVSALLARLRQPDALVRRIWEPLCVAALNTGLEEACALTFAHVLRDSLGSARDASDFLLPRTTLSEVLPRPAARWLEARGARIFAPARVTAIAHDAGGWSLESSRGAWRGGALVLAVPPAGAARLLRTASDAAAVRALAAELERFDDDGIATVYLGWPAASAPALPAWTMLAEDAPRGLYGQWLFDRGVAGAMRVAGVVVSARGRLANVTADALADSVAAQVAAQLRVAAPAGRRTIVEKHATFRCRPDRPRIAPDAARTAGLPGLALAGDYAYPDYPATLESAVRSAACAARMLLATAPVQDRPSRGPALGAR